MDEYEFELDVRGNLTGDTIDALFEAGCNDAVFVGNEGDEVFKAHFIREAFGIADAVVSAIRNVESVPGLKVIQTRR
jgi:hypothetical protein